MKPDLTEETAEAAELVLRREEDGRLVLLRGEERIAVTARPCFPWSHPREYLSLRDKENKEAALVRSIDVLDEPSAEAVKASLAESSFTIEVTAIRKAEKDYELRVWEVETADGVRQFQQELEDWPQNLPDGSVVIQDLAGDLYRIADPAKLDKASAKILWAFVD